MQRIFLKSKIHNAKVTQSELYYEGSITIDSGLLERTDILENERVQVVSLNTGARFETYVIKGKKGSGVICLNGPAARMANPGDIVHIISYAWLNDDEIIKHKPKVVILDGENKIAKEK